jgi:hypothetical protein
MYRTDLRADYAPAAPSRAEASSGFTPREFFWAFGVQLSLWLGLALLAHLLIPATGLN